MMYSNYNIYMKDFPKVNYTTIYNLFTKKMIALNSESVIFNSHSEKMEKKLFELGMKVENEKIEYNLVENSYYEKVNSMDTLNITLILTNKCNCKCIYCYEEQFDLKFSSTSDIIKTVNFINKKMESYRRLVVTFFGGEPLLCKDKIYEFSSIFKSLYKDNYEFAIITNGTLIKREDIESWQLMGLVCLKITLDGNSSSHNSRRSLKNGQLSYEKIIENLESIKEFDSINITIVLIVDEFISGIEEMVRTVQQMLTNVSFVLSIREPDSYDYKTKSRLLLDAAKIIRDNNGFQYSKISTNHGEICVGKERNTFVLDGNGNAYACTAKLNKVIGNFYKEENISKGKYIIKESCKVCKYLPICYGDCMYEEKCEKDFFEYFIPRWLSLFIQNNC